MRERLDTLEALMDAVEGYHHLSADALFQYLTDHYTVDLDILAQLADALETNALQTMNDMTRVAKASVA